MELYAPNALTTIEKAASFLGVAEELEAEKLTETTQLQHYLAQAINVASSAIERYCFRKFGFQRHKQYRKKATDLLFVDEYPVFSLFVDEEPYPHIEYIEEESGMIHLTRSVQGEVTYEAGYVLPKDATEERPQTLPHDLEQLCLRVVNHVFTDDDGYLGDVSDLKLGDWSTKLAAAASKPDGLIPSDVALGLNQYKRIAFGEWDE